VNNKLKDTGNTLGHELLKSYQNNKEAVNNILLLLAKQKFNFEEPNKEGISTIEKAKLEGINLEDYVSFCNLLEKDESVI